MECYFLVLLSYQVASTLEMFSFRCLRNNVPLTLSLSVSVPLDANKIVGGLEWMELHYYP